jgi:large subunit ribosomal protein L31
MKDKIHPETKETQFVCACGNKFTALSTLGGEHHVEICNACHPFFTGKEKLIDTAGRIEKFNRRYGKKTPDKAAPAASAKA